MKAPSIMRTRPRSRPRILLTIAASAFAAGCALSIRPLGGEPANGAVTVVPSLTAAGYRPQTVVTKNLAVDVKHVVVKLFKVENDAETLAAQAMDVPKADVGRTVRFSYLNFNTKYRVRGYAYKAEGDGEADLVSKDAYVDVTVATDDRPAIANLAIPLADVTFSGAGTGSIEVKGGTVTDAGTFSVVMP